MPIAGLATQAVASVQLGVSTSVLNAPTFAQTVSQNPGLAADHASSGVSQFSVRFRELFSTAFKKRNIATSAADPAEPVVHADPEYVVSSEAHISLETIGAPFA